MPATTGTLTDLACRWKALKSVLDDGYKELKELEAQFVFCVKTEYPDEWDALMKGRSSFTVEGVTLPIKRTWDAALLASVLGEEEYREIVTEETVVKQTIDGKKLAAMMKDAAQARRLEPALVPFVPKLAIK